MQKLEPTYEQQEIIRAFRTEQILKVNACAGSGKSSTLRLLAEDNEKPSLYVCFNKSIAEEARQKFPKHVDCRTTHSLAYSKFGIGLISKLSRPIGKYQNVAGTPTEIAQYYKMNDWKVADKEITAAAQASLVRQVVNRFQNSSHTQITKQLIGYYDLQDLYKSFPELNVHEYIEFIVRQAKKLWLDRVDTKSSVLATHDTYLKLWQLSNPHLDYEILYVDEAQDSNPAVLDVIQKQKHCKIVYVGDTHQSIYAFRQAVNAMETIVAPTKILSKSFRYGQAIADVASAVIDYEMDIKGNTDVPSKIGTVEGNEYTMLFRTNSALLEQAVLMLSKGESIQVDIDTKEFVKKLESVNALWRGDMKQVKHADITPYSSWEELVIATQEDVELKRLVKIVETGKAGFYVKHLDKLNKKARYDVLLTTAHKSKGKEWDSVVIASDFPIDWVTDPDVEDSIAKTQEINLLYVACTRAIKVLQLPSNMVIQYETTEETR